MKRNPDFIKRRIAEEVMLVPTGKAAQHFNGMITLSSVGEYIYDHVEEVASMEELLQLLQDEYDVDAPRAASETVQFTNQLLANGIIIKETPIW